MSNHRIRIYSDETEARVELARLSNRVHNLNLTYYDSLDIDDCTNGRNQTDPYTKVWVLTFE